jgi:Rrf2 family protein
MKLTTRGHYSVKALLDLSLQPGYRPTSVRAIAHRQDLPAAYLEKLLIQMRRAGLVQSVRGAQGGYQLAQSPDRISLGQILEAVGETIEPLPRHTPDAQQPEDWVTFTVFLSRISTTMPAVGKPPKGKRRVLSFNEGEQPSL